MNPWERDWGDSGGAKAAPWDRDWDTPAPPPVTATDRAQAAGAGVNRGVLVNLAGLPVATALNVYDLGKAGVGAAMGAFGAKPENLPELTDRSKVVGAPEWIARQFEEHGAGAAINPNRPDDAPSRYLHAGGQGAAGAVLPSTLPAALATGAMGAGSMMAGEAAADMGAGPAGQVLATTLLPGATAAAGARSRGALTTAQRTAAQRAAVDDTIREAQEAGLKFPPAQVNPSLANKVIGGLSGKAATEQAASLDNQPVVNQFARDALKLPEHTPLTRKLLAEVREEAGKDYDAVKSFGAITADAPYLQRVAGLQDKYRASIGAAGGAAPMKSLRVTAVEELLQDADRPQFSSENAIELIKRLRRDADGNFARGEKETAKYQKSVANALEELVGNNLAAAQQPELLTNFQAARTRIAQSYDVEKALNKGTGNVDANKLAKALEKGRPLTGGLLTAAKAASFAPMSMRDFKQTPPGISALDWGISAGAGGLAAGLGLGPASAVPLALPVARLAARKAVLSKPYQNYMARPRTGAPSPLAKALAAADDEGALTASTLSDDELRRRYPFTQGN